MIDIQPYLKRRTLILGDVNSGKTARTRAIMSSFCAAGHAGDPDRMMVLLKSADTCVVNAYRKKTFTPSVITFWEKERLVLLIAGCDRLEYL